VSQPSGIPLIDRAVARPDRVAVADATGERPYSWLLERSGVAARTLLDGRPDLAGERVALFLAPGAEVAVALLGVWRAGGVAVPLCVDHPRPELEHVLADSGARTVIASRGLGRRIDPLVARRGVARVSTDLWHGASAPDSTGLPISGPGRDALILYTSGTTSRPKGVVSTHLGIEAQTQSLIQAWGWTADDRLLNVLPLHHTHGLVAGLICALRVGACCEMAPFDPDDVWDRLIEGRATVFMAVPTIYVKLLSRHLDAPPERRLAMSEAAAALRLAVSGSAALPVSVFEGWRDLSGEPLLERYGMTETGLAISNPLAGERRAGSVGAPLPLVEARLADDDGSIIREEGVEGELQFRGPTLFRTYWNRPTATREAFRDGWFRSGDVAVLERGFHRILGRRSVDIIKSGGYKISAIELEETLRAHPAVVDCAVVGVTDAEWGERVCAAVVPSGPGLIEAPCTELEGWMRERVARYKLPKSWRLVEELPRNAMGKVAKLAVKRMFATSGLERNDP